MTPNELRWDGLKQGMRGSQDEPGIGIAAVALSCVTAIAWLHSHPLVLPLLSVILVSASLLMAGAVVLRRRGTAMPLVERLHLAGLVMFFGFAAAIMGDPDLAVKALDGQRG